MEGKFGFLYVCLQLVVFDDGVYYSNGKLKAPTEMKSIEALRWVANPRFTD
ncbi:hypothetical protein [Listeria booriae]|uniref:hypothetical protein n=1 Tax=Listeria booriae TaxID=1552123 RepID=UPI001629A21C|nr:hypothetical protein [Listeria booriae]MBC2188004.1 hypothetical protein [Listeria booriae]